VALENWEEIVSATGVAVGHPQFFSRLFSQLTKRLKVRGSDSLQKVCLKEYDGLSRHLAVTGIQEGCAARNNLKTRRLAQLLIDDKGSLDVPLLKKAISKLTEHLYSLGPGREPDMIRQEHILQALIALNERRELQLLLRTITKPFANPAADQLIRDTLQLDDRAAVSDAQARRATLAAWLCYLRQSVGSCFATAPAIIIHDEQPERFLKDIRDLLNTGRMKRTFAGVEYTVPISSSWGAGDLKRPVIGARDIEELPRPLWEAPGFLVALVAAGVIDEGLSLNERMAATKELIKTFFGKNHRRFFLTTTEDIFKSLIQETLGLSLQEIEEYESRPKEPFGVGLVVQAPVKKGGLKSLGARCQEYYQNLTRACKAFKALTDNALLKGWEFTLASFAEVKANLARYNFYSSLGLAAEDVGGIGQCIYSILKDRVDEANRETQDLNDQYEQMYMQVKHFEGRMQRASSEKDLRWMKMEYRNRLSDFRHLEALRGDSVRRAKRLANLFNVLIDIYDKKFVEYFQEVYDADIVEVTPGPYDDSPAGFHLLYKAGRSAVSQWERISTPLQFVDALVGFFVTTEKEILDSPELEGLEEDISRVVTAVVTHVKTQEFLETAFHRMARAHKVPMIEHPLENLDRVEKKPWVYTSGGTMGSLVSSYFGREMMPHEVSRWVESPTELCVFLIDTVKQMSPKASGLFLEEPKKSLLIHSPTHAFLLKPGLPLFSQGWQSELYTYTWVRDEIITPSTLFVENLQLDGAMIDNLLERLASKLPLQYRLPFKLACKHLPRRMRCSEFRRQVVNILEDKPFNQPLGGVPLESADVDGLLYSLLPMMDETLFCKAVTRVLREVLGSDEGKGTAALLDGVFQRAGHSRVYTSKDLREVCLSLIMLNRGSVTAPDAYPALIARAAQKLKFAMPAPLLFADSNWAKDGFGFVINPGTGHFELWRLNATGTAGEPMSAWNKWLDGSQKDRLWGIYTRPHEYRSA